MLYDAAPNIVQDMLFLVVPHLMRQHSHQLVHRVLFNEGGKKHNASILAESGK
jgi:hypothetical protein